MNKIILIIMFMLLTITDKIAANIIDQFGINIMNIQADDRNNIKYILKKNNQYFICINENIQSKPFKTYIDAKNELLIKITTYKNNNRFEFGHEDNKYFFKIISKKGVISYGPLSYIYLKAFSSNSNNFVIQYNLNGEVHFVSAESESSGEADSVRIAGGLNILLLDNGTTYTNVGNVYFFNEETYEHVLIDSLMYTRNKYKKYLDGYYGAAFWITNNISKKIVINNNEYYPPINGEITYNYGFINSGDDFIYVIKQYIDSEVFDIEETNVGHYFNEWRTNIYKRKIKNCNYYVIKNDKIIDSFLASNQLVKQWRYFYNNKTPKYALSIDKIVNNNTNNYIYCNNNYYGPFVRTYIHSLNDNGVFYSATIGNSNYFYFNDNKYELNNFYYYSSSDYYVKLNTKESNIFLDQYGNIISIKNNIIFSNNGAYEIDKREEVFFLTKLSILLYFEL